MLITEAELRELWRNGRHPLPAFPPGTRFTPAAADFLKDHGLTPVFGSPQPAPTAAPISNFQSPLPLDTLHALAGLVAAEARRAHLPELAAHLDTLTAYCGELHQAALAARPASRLAWGGGQPAAWAPPAPLDHAVLHWLNLLRASAREAAPAMPEAATVAAAVEDLMALFASGRLAWTVSDPP